MGERMENMNALQFTKISFFVKIAARTFKTQVNVLY